MPEGEYRLADLDRRITRIEGRLDAIGDFLRVQAVLEERMRQLQNKIETIENSTNNRIDKVEINATNRLDKQDESVKGLNRTFIGCGIAVTISAIGYAITTTQFFG
jgi:hypothetical protein